MNRPERMKIIILNNSGGGIFRFLKGPSALKEFIPYIETPESVNIKGIADAYGLCYYEAKDEDYLKNNLCRFFKDSSCAIMNIITPPEKNGEIFKEYFKYLRTN